MKPPVAKPPVKHYKPKAARKETVIPVRVTEEQFARIKHQADQTGCAVATWLRITALAATGA